MPAGAEGWKMKRLPIIRYIRYCITMYRIKTVNKAIIVATLKLLAECQPVPK
jgi:hypothetical protein